MSECPRDNILTKKLPWVLMYWDNVGGWQIARRARTRKGVTRGWEHLLRHGIGYAVMKVMNAQMPSLNDCNCEWHLEHRKHFHPCTEGCE